MKGYRRSIMINSRVANRFRSCLKTWFRGPRNDGLSLSTLQEAADFPLHRPT